MTTAIRNFKQIHVPNVGTFSPRICTECAYRDTKTCTITNQTIRNLEKCPDGYTLELCRDFDNDNFSVTLTGKHTKVFYNWKPLRPDAPYPVNKTRFEDDD